MHLVSGNPMTARPESGVGNAHPGLEFDVRVLDRHFMPGLVFDFQYGAGAKLSALKPAENPDLPSLTADDLKQDLFLLLVKAIRPLPEKFHGLSPLRKTSVIVSRTYEAHWKRMSQSRQCSAPGEANLSTLW